MGSAGGKMTKAPAAGRWGRLGTPWLWAEAVG
jgi:hypothetical protein